MSKFKQFWYRVAHYENVATEENPFTKERYFQKTGRFHIRPVFEIICWQPLIAWPLAFSLVGLLLSFANGSALGMVSCGAFITILSSLLQTIVAGQLADDALKNSVDQGFAKLATKIVGSQQRRVDGRVNLSHSDIPSVDFHPSVKKLIAWTRMVSLSLAVLGTLAMAFANEIAQFMQGEAYHAAH